MSESINDETKGENSMFQIQRLCKINKIEIDNPQNWDVAANLKNLINDKFIPDRNDKSTTLPKSN